MTLSEATDIIDKYQDALERETTVRRKSDLPCSKAKIKQSFYTFLTELYKQQGTLRQEFADQVMVAYSKLDTFLDDDEADEMDAILEQRTKKVKLTSEQVGKYMSYTFSLAGSVELLEEISLYIDNIMGN